MKIKNVILLSFSVFLFINCKTAEFGHKVFNVNGMVYDFSNRPIPYCEITLGKYNSITDINGRFTLPKVPVNGYIIIVEKKGYETHTDTILINNRNQIIYIRIPSQYQLLELADQALTNNDLLTAEKMIERAYLIDQNNIEMLFYYATVKFRHKDYEAAISFLEEAKRLGSRDIYVEKFLENLRELQNAEKTN